MSSKIKLALVDDHSLFRKGLQSLLEDEEDFEVILESSNPQSFLESLEELSVKPDIILCDIKMPAMLGYELTEILTEKYPTIKVLALSMYADEGSIIKMISSGASGYILKGSDPWELVQAVRAIQRDGVYLNEQGTIALMNKFKNVDSYNLTDLDREFLINCCSEMSYKEIAEKMEVSERTVHGYRDKLFPVIKVKNRIGAVLFAIKHGVFNFDD